MSVTSDDRWSCPESGCHTTVVIAGKSDDVRAAIDAVRTRHGVLHRRIRPRLVEQPRAPRQRKAA